ncbi:MAG: hypothetical protein O2912_02195 [Proteobacteria bacterium]|nr:hypothetical protein [Pseudomonadota bacterium]
MSEAPQKPKTSKALQFWGATGLVALIAGVVAAMRFYGVGANIISTATTILTVGSLLALSKRYGTRSLPVLTFMFWILAAMITIIFAGRS